MSAEALLTIILDAGGKAGLLLLPAVLLARIARRASAAFRHLVCLAALVTALLLPLLGAVVPRVPLPVLPAEAAADSGGDVSRLPVILLTAWASVAAGLLLSRLRGLLGVRRLLVAARPVRDARILTRALAAREEIGLTAPLRILSHPGVTVPATWGILRAAVILPPEARTWPPSRLRAILLHELSHVKRRDCLTQLVAEIICTLYWFQPLAWMSAARMREEREAACDDPVLARGARPSRYAMLLFSMLTGSPRPEPVLAFGDGRRLRRRLRSLFGDRRHRCGVSRGTGAAILTGVLLAGSLLAALTPVAAGPVSAAPPRWPLPTVLDAAALCVAAAPPAARAPVEPDPSPLPVTAPRPEQPAGVALPAALLSRWIERLGIPRDGRPVLRWEFVIRTTSGSVLHRTGGVE